MSFLLCREREREHQRQELWQRVETLASSKSELDLNRSISGDINSMTSSPDPDSESGLENVEQDSNDVSFMYEIFDEILIKQVHLIFLGNFLYFPVLKI